KSSIFLRRIAGSMFMRVNSKCAHHRARRFGNRFSRGCSGFGGLTSPRSPISTQKPRRGWSVIASRHSESLGARKTRYEGMDFAKDQILARHPEVVSAAGHIDDARVGHVLFQLS